MQPPPSPYTETATTTHAGRTYHLAPVAVKEVSAALDAATDGTGDGRGGRGGIVRQGRIIARRCRRGGLMRYLTHDGYLRNRALAEFEVHRAAHLAGLPVPEVLGVCWDKRGFLYHGALATRALDGVELLTALLGAPQQAEALLRATGEAVAQMHDAGFWHADLQVRNVLVNTAGTVYLIDWDHAWQRDRVSRFRRAMNCYRFRRSLEKHGFGPAYFRHFCAGYGAAPGLPLLGWWYALRSRVRGRATRRDVGNA